MVDCIVRCDRQEETGSPNNGEVTIGGSQGNRTSSRSPVRKDDLVLDAQDVLTVAADHSVPPCTGSASLFSRKPCDELRRGAVPEPGSRSATHSRTVLSRIPR